MLEKVDNDGIFTGDSRKNLFTIIAKNKIDVNSKFTKVGQHYHGISMTIMQFKGVIPKIRTTRKLYRFQAITL